MWRLPDGQEDVEAKGSLWRRFHEAMLLHETGTTWR
jgi:hypothetical protein